MAASKFDELTHGELNRRGVYGATEYARAAASVLGSHGAGVLAAEYGPRAHFLPDGWPMAQPFEVDSYFPAMLQGPNTGTRYAVHAVRVTGRKLRHGAPAPGRALRAVVELVGGTELAGWLVP